MRDRDDVNPIEVIGLRFANKPGDCSGYIQTPNSKVLAAELSHIAARWPHLSDSIRQAIMTLVGCDAPDTTIRE
ncbi:hypothetical protein [Thalassoroseus pseudoceratinae]|uniref:hypothetical protein n=1 Tax=Thalassoroseus pseudoceratinae TaxID=2713176 RepID=UPI0014209789|nr:hypothetical protein [Thalassoroseus pseudoceratinae]